jgi:hypothetical protein
MREPYETLLGQYRDHRLLWEYLQGYEPDWPALAGNERRLEQQLSRGERLMVHIAWAFYNGDPTARVADLAILDDDNRQRVMDAIHLAMEAFR